MSFGSLQQDLPEIMLPWEGRSLRGERLYHRVDQSEHTLTQVAALIVEGNPELAGFQPNLSVVATWIFGLYESELRVDRVSVFIMNVAPMLARR